MASALQGNGGPIQTESTAHRAGSRLLQSRFTLFQQCEDDEKTRRTHDSRFCAKRNYKIAREFATSSLLRTLAHLHRVGNVVEVIDNAVFAF